MPRRLLRPLLAGFLALAAATVASARIQGVEGRRIAVFGDLEPYRGGDVVVLEPTLGPEPKKERLKRQMLRRHLQWMTHEFLITRLRELPWSVSPWYGALGSMAQLADGERTLLVESDLLWERRELSLVVYLRDARSGKLLARFQGYGQTVVRGARAGARDDLQEITRLLVAYLANELKVGQPDWFGYEPQPFRRRDREAPRIPMIEVDKDRARPGTP